MKLLNFTVFWFVALLMYIHFKGLYLTACIFTVDFHRELLSKLCCTLNIDYKIADIHISSSRYVYTQPQGYIGFSTG